MHGITSCGEINSILLGGEFMTLGIEESTSRLIRRQNAIIVGPEYLPTIPQYDLPGIRPTDYQIWVEFGQSG